MKKLFFIAMSVAGSLLAQTNAPAPAATNTPQITAIDGYAARVDNEIITYGEVRESAMPLLQQLVQRYQGEELQQRIQQAYMQTREAMIEEKLLSAEAQELGLALPEQAINDEVERMIRDRFNGDRTLLSRALAARRMTFEEWKADVAQQLTVRVFYNQEVVRRATVRQQDVQDAYEAHKEEFYIPLKVKFRAILINKGKTDEDRAVKKEQVESIRRRLLEGSDFAATAKEVSEGIRADDGGAFPWSEPKDIRAELRPALENLPAGEVSEIIETDDEFYLIKVEERRGAGYIPFEDVRGRIEQQLLAKEQDRLHEQLIARLAAKHFVERY